MLGNRYGYIPLPSTIEKKEFDILTNIARDNERDISALKAWYLLDENYLSPQYVLQVCLQASK